MPGIYCLWAGPDFSVFPEIAVIQSAQTVECLDQPGTEDAWQGTSSEHDSAFLFPEKLSLVKNKNTSRPFPSFPSAFIFPLWGLVAPGRPVEPSRLLAAECVPGFCCSSGLLGCGVRELLSLIGWQIGDHCRSLCVRAQKINPCTRDGGDVL